MEQEQYVGNYKKRRPGAGCIVVCLLLVPVAVLLAAVRIVWCLIDRLSSVMGNGNSAE